MSIATSVLIHSSRVMRWLLTGIAACACISWFCVLCWILPHADWLIASLASAVSLLLFCVVLRTLLHTLRQTITMSLNVSRDGDILLRWLDASGRAIESDLVKLKSPSILWPLLMLLTLQNESGKVLRLLILRDSVSDAGFRHLNVAFHWLAQARTPTSAQNDLSEGNF